MSCHPRSTAGLTPAAPGTPGSQHGRLPRPSPVAVDYLTACTSPDVDKAPWLLADHFSFQGASGGPEAVLQSLRGLGRLCQWAAGDDVPSLNESHPDTRTGPAALRITDWSTVRDRCLVSALVVFDAGAPQQVLARRRRAGARSR